MPEKESTFNAAGKKGKDWWCSGLVGRLFLLILCCLYNQRHRKRNQALVYVDTLGVSSERVG